VSSGPRAALPIVAGSRSTITDNPGSASTRSGLSAVSPTRPDNASIEKSTRRQPRAPASHRQRAVSAAGAPFVPKVSSAGNHQGSHHLTADVVRNRPGRRTGNPPQLLKQ
jgi:hypothetical protein